MDGFITPAHVFLGHARQYSTIINIDRINRAPLKKKKKKKEIHFHKNFGHSVRLKRKVNRKPANLPTRLQQAYVPPGRNPSPERPVLQVTARLPRQLVKHRIQQPADYYVLCLPQPLVQSVEYPVLQSGSHNFEQPYDEGVQLDLESQQLFRKVPNLKERGMSTIALAISGAGSFLTKLLQPTRLLWRQEEQPEREDINLDNDTEESSREEVAQATKRRRLSSQENGGNNQQNYDDLDEAKPGDKILTMTTSPSNGVHNSLVDPDVPFTLTDDFADVAKLVDRYGSMSIETAQKPSSVAPPNTLAESYSSRKIDGNQKPPPTLGQRKLLRLPSRHTRYKDPRDFFNHERAHSLPGVEDLKPNPTRVAEDNATRQAREEAERQKEGQQRREDAKRLREVADERLKPLGLRTPLTPFIAPLSQEWRAKVEAATQRESPPVKTCAPEIIDFQSRDFGRMVPPTIWLNDNAIQAATQFGADYINKTAGVTIKKDTPKCVALNSFFWSQLVSTGVHKKERMLKRVWGLTPHNFLDVESIIIPINEHSHWTFILIRPHRREVAYVDSFHQDNAFRITKIHEFIAAFLGQNYKVEEWKNISFEVPLQTNGYDCGMFVITNSILLALGLDPSGYKQKDMPLQRQRIAAMILNGGFHGDFNLADL